MNQPLGASVADIWKALLMSIKRQFSKPLLLQLVKSYPFIYLPPKKGTPPLIVHYRVSTPPTPFPPVGVKQDT